MSAEHRTSAWAKARSIARPRLAAIIAAGEGWCHDGRHRLAPGSAFDVSHVHSIASMKAQGIPESEWHDQNNLVASCKKHNRAAGGRAGAKKSNHTRATAAGRVDEW